jgi:hypothetical protein
MVYIDDLTGLPEVSYFGFRGKRGLYLLAAEVLERTRRTHGEASNKYLGILLDIALLYRDAGRHSEAVDLTRQVLDARPLVAEYLETLGSRASRRGISPRPRPWR